jgi:hypothetical protein
MARKNFPNGFASWMETHFHVASAIALELEKDTITSKVIAERYEAQGSGGMYELSEELTDKFEKMNKGKFWDGEYLDEIDEFLEKEIKL